MRCRAGVELGEAVSETILTRILAYIPTLLV